MSILTFHLTRQLTVSTFLVTVLLTAALWMTQSLRLIEILVNRSVASLSFIKLIFLLLPDLIGLILPISLLITVLFTYNRLLVDNELIILRSIGMTDLKIIKPVFIVSGFVILILYMINLYFLPLAFQKFKTLEYQIRNTINSKMIQAGEFNNFKNIMVYVRTHQKDGTMTGILINDSRNPEKTYAVTAEFGKIIENTLGTHLVLINGSRQDFDYQTNRPTILSFDQYSVDLNTQNSALPIRQRKPYERFITELLNPDKENIDSNMQRKYAVEAHQRLIMPLTSLIFSLTAVNFLLQGDYNRRGKSKKILSAVILCAILQGLLLILIHLIEKVPFITPLAYVIAISAFAIPLGRFVHQARRHNKIQMEILQP